MIVALWHRWTKTKQTWWLALIAAVLLLDLLIGSWLIAWEIRLLKEAWNG